MEYKELQKQAKELGLAYVGVSADDLEKSIQEAQNSSEDSPKETKSTSKSKEKNVKSEANTAVVLDGTREVRSYESSIHGKGFKELAHEFADKRGFQVKLENLEVGIVCPHCGKKLNRKKLGL